MTKIHFGLRKGLLWVIVCLLAVSLPYHADTFQSNQRSDLIQIRLPSLPEGDQMPGVCFPHDRHTEAIEKQSCKKCHLKKENIFVFKFNRLQDRDFETDKELYHADCIGCHLEIRDQGKNSGPVTGECRLCHSTASKYINAALPFGMDKSLHFRHTIAETIRPANNFDMEKDGNCSSCHHEYDKEQKKTVYAKGKEGTCRYCHKPEMTEDVRSFQTVAHEGCVNCHIDLNLRNIKTGPIHCSGCHDLSDQLKIIKVEEIPRIKRNQPDAVLLSTWLKDAIGSGKPSHQFVRPVAFNHLFHEEKVDSCRSCHHADMDACSTCHTRIGTEKGGFVSIEQAMHATTALESCAGCHNNSMTASDCAGCHIQRNHHNFSENNCGTCHIVNRQSLEPLPLTKETITQIAATEMNARAVPAPIPEDQIPEKVTIDIMKDQYEGVLMPHRQIVQALSKRLQTSKLASHFHNEPSTLCWGCHHHRPSTDTYPKCAACHDISLKTEQNGKPGLMGAYHGQCIGCHQRMGIEKPISTDCTACHKKREEMVQATD